MTILTNARLVLDGEVLHGTVLIDGTTITEFQPGRSNAPGAIDLDGDILMPGIVDVHTDNLERQVQPRSNARWPSRSAMLTHDAQCAVCGVTTVLDALCLGDLGFDKDRIKTFHDGVRDLDALDGTGLLKSEHYLHLRCELPASDVMDLLEPVADHRLVRMVSLMDHSPGAGQYADLDRYRAMRKREGIATETVERRIVELQAQRALMRDVNRQRLLQRMAGSGVVLASHDDRTEEEIEENHRDGIRISEFPVSMIAAKAARARGMLVIAGAPNIVRGGSHSGNVSAAELVRERAVDGLASDYVPASLVEAAFACVEQTGITLPEGVAMVTAAPAAMAGLTDRGRIAAGLRADLVRIREHEGIPVVRQVWRAGERVILTLRVAIYYAPELDDPLWTAGCSWLGRDPERAVAVPQPALDGIGEVTADARSYGFHCTLKPPMRLATSYGAFRDEISAMVQSLRPFELPKLAVADLSGFLAVRETAPCPALQALADACVAWPDRHRAPPDTAELQRRRGKGLAPDADQLLLRWGYPGVFGRWRFHMTLTRRLQDQAAWKTAAEAHFAAALAHRRLVASICLFTQAGPGTPFLLAERVALPTG